MSVKSASLNEPATVLYVPQCRNAAVDPQTILDDRAADAGLMSQIRLMRLPAQQPLRHLLVVEIVGLPALARVAAEEEPRNVFDPSFGMKFE